MRSVRLLLLGLAVSLGTSAGAEDKKPEAKKPAWTGTIKIEGQHSKFALAEKAKVPMMDAVSKARASLKGTDADKKVVDVELETDDGYLVWEVEVAVRNLEGVMKVIIDAGSGEILATEHEKEDKPESLQDKKPK